MTSNKMNKTRWIFRLAFFVAAVFLLIDINRKSNDNTQSLVEFKYKTFKQIEKDSLNTKSKLDILINETTKFVDDSDHVRNGIQYLTLLVALIVLAETIFLILSKTSRLRS
jgi:hypothetical protein